MMFFPAKAGPHHNILPDCQFLEGPDHLVGPGQPPAGSLVWRFAGNVLASKNYASLFGFIHPIDDIE